MRTFLLLLSLSSPMFGQWFKVASSTAPVPISFTSAATYRYGTNVGTTTVGKDCSKGQGCWTTVNVTAGAKIQSMANIPDAAPGLTKELDIYQTATTQTVTVNGAPIQIPPKGASGTWNITCTGSGPLTLDANGIPTSFATTNMKCTAVPQ